jgi:hypothetical protein
MISIGVRTLSSGLLVQVAGRPERWPGRDTTQAAKIAMAVLAEETRSRRRMRLMNMFCAYCHEA